MVLPRSSRLRARAKAVEAWTDTAEQIARQFVLSDFDDPNSSDGPGENADGFGAHYPPAGKATNVFRGCRAWWNADDGFDLISTYSPVTIESSWAWRNGYLPGTTTASGTSRGI